MRAAFLESVHHLVLKDIPEPEITRGDEVRIRVDTVGVCGSEVHAFEGTHPTRIAPVLLGHELAGTVEAVGREVTHFRAGDRVIVDPQWSCGKCEHCLAGDINLCEKKKVLGTQLWPGAFGHVITSPEEAVFPLPENLSFEQGAMIEPLTIGVHVAHRTNMGPGKSVVILGSGSIGGMVSGVARSTGASPVVAVDIRQHCLDAARERMGATHDFLLPDDHIVQKVKQATGPAGADIVVITADDIKLMDIALDVVKRRGTIVLVALLTEEPLQFIGYRVIAKEVNIIGSTMSNPGDVREAIELAKTGKVDVMGIVTHTLPIEEAQKGMELASTKDENAIKVLLKF